MSKLEPQIEFQVEYEATRLLFRNTGLAQFVTIFNATVLVFIFGGRHPPFWAAAWWGAMSVVSLLRYGMARRFGDGAHLSVETCGLWRRRATLGALLAGVVWAAGCAAMMLADPGATRLFVALMSAGMVAGAVPILSSVQNAFRAYSIPIGTAVVMVALFDAHGSTDWVLAVLASLFVGALLSSSRYFHASLERSTRLAAEMQTLARKLENSEQMFRTLAESTSAAIFTYRDRIEYINPAGERLCNYSLDELRSIPLTDLVHPDDRAAIDARAGERVRGKTEFSQYEYRILTKDGHTRWILFHGALVMVDGQRLGLGSAFDITARKEAERRLQENESIFHTMLDWTHDWEYWSSPDGHFIYMTPSSERITGYTPAEFFADLDLIRAIVHPDDRPLWDRHRNQRPPGDAATIEFRILKKSGEVRWVNHVSRPIRDAAGGQKGLRVAVRDITDAKAAEQEIHKLAHFDTLTHLPNRRLLMERISQALGASNRRGDYGALLILDIDQFKALNDTEGHDIGDSLLVEVARRLSACVRREDTVARLGGDEYVVLLEALGQRECVAAAQAESIAEKIRAELARPYPLGENRADYHSSVSVGLTLLRGLERPPDILLKEADVALYQAKDAGRNTVRFFDPVIQSSIEARLAMITAMRKGLEHGEFALHYQPQFDDQQRIVGAEALLRWTRADAGPVSPQIFIPLAEDSGLIVPIGRWILDTACAQLKRWEQDPKVPTLRLAVNVSALQFRQDDFVDTVRQSLETHGVNPRLLKLELTESVVLNAIDGVIDRMRQLNALGVEFALDDFGTGYSSLSYLKHLPLAQVKIDQSFVRDAPQCESDAVIVKAILAIGQALGLHVVAEGVETAEQLAFLKLNGCREFQGYLFGRPTPIEEWDLFLG